MQDLIFKINNFLYLLKVKLFETEKLINDLKMRELENKQKQELIDELIFKQTPHDQYKGDESGQDDGLIINPIWQMSVRDEEGKEVLGWPLLYFAHFALKAQGFDPDHKLRDPNVKVRISMEIGKYVQFPLYIRGQNLPEGTMLQNLNPAIGVIDKGN